MNTLSDFWKLDKAFPSKLKDKVEIANKEINNLLLNIEIKRPTYSKLDFLYQLAPPELRNFMYKLLFKNKKGRYNDHMPRVDILRRRILKSLKKANKEIKAVSLWEKGKKFAISLSHDCDSSSAYKNIDYTREIEEKFGFKSCWNFPSHQYKIDKEKLRKLKKQGCEIGLHGYKHDVSFPFEKEGIIRNRIKHSLKMLQGFDLKGYRSPLLLRSDTLFKVLKDYFLYDSSVHDFDISSPYKLKSDKSRTGCETIFPYFIQPGLVELPVTMIQDFRMIKLGFSKNQIYRAWKKKIDLIRGYGGMVMLLTHPDDHIFGNEEYFDVYERILNYLSKFDNAYRALPYEIAEWWKERDNSKIKDGKVVGSKRAVIQVT